MFLALSSLNCPPADGALKPENPWSTQGAHTSEVALRLGGVLVPVLLGFSPFLEAAFASGVAFVVLVFASVLGFVAGLGAGFCSALAGFVEPGEAIDLMALAGRVIANDSGLMHVAAAFGVPQAAVFGSSSPLHTPPLNSRAAVLWLKNDPAYQPPLDCAPCFERECPLGHTRCLNDIAADRVVSALQTVS